MTMVPGGNLDNSRRIASASVQATAPATMIRMPSSSSSASARVGVRLPSFGVVARAWQLHAVVLPRLPHRPEREQPRPTALGTRRIGYSAGEEPLIPDEELP